jgi:hypothetical protein
MPQGMDAGPARPNKTGDFISCRYAGHWQATKLLEPRKRLQELSILSARLEMLQPLT